MVQVYYGYVQNDMKTRIRRTIMNDPYSVLGISRGATDDEIKKKSIPGTKPKISPGCKYQ
mgnify:CR=1 FL=1